RRDPRRDLPRRALVPSPPALPRDGRVGAAVLDSMDRIWTLGARRRGGVAKAPRGRGSGGVSGAARGVGHREPAHVEESGEVEKEERQRRPEAGARERQHGPREVGAERELEEHVGAYRRSIALAAPPVPPRLEPELWRPVEGPRAAEESLEDRARVVDRESDPQRHHERNPTEPRE